jgi:hypothetical protein
VPTSQITRARYPFPGNGFSTGTMTSNHYEVFLPFPAAVLLQQLPASEFASLITALHGSNGKHSLCCWRSLFTAPLLSRGLPIVFTGLSGPLPTSGLYCCGNAFWEVWEVLTPVVMKSSVFWDMTPCSPLKVNRRNISPLRCIATAVLVTVH